MDGLDHLILYQYSRSNDGVGALYRRCLQPMPKYTMMPRIDQDSISVLENGMVYGNLHLNRLPKL
jgi:hypothetical protein